MDDVSMDIVTPTSMENRLNLVPRMGRVKSRPSFLATSAEGSARKLIESWAPNAWAHASRANGSFTDMHTTLSTPLFLNSGIESRNSIAK